MKIIRLFFVFLTLYSCVADDNVPIIFSTNSLAEDIQNQLFLTDAVIACAAGDSMDADLVNTFLYLEEGASDLRFYESNAVDIDPNDFEYYFRRDIPSRSFLDGSLRVFDRYYGEEQWIVVTYRIDNRVKLSTPIRTKNVNQPTLYSEAVTVDQQETGSPFFDWEVESYENNAVFFQVVYTDEEEVLSRTYTNESQFKYFDLSNVILNLTEGTPPNLTPGLSYNFLVMDVSLDNWVNQIYNINFEAE